MSTTPYLRRLWLGAVLAAACSSPVDSPPSPSTLTGSGPFVVSNAVSIGSAGHDAPQGSNRSGTLVFVSLPPGTLTSGTGVSIRVHGTGTVVSAPLVSGGLDPVAVPAAEGDTLTLTVTGPDAPGTEFVFTVPPTRPPTILRTYPEKNRRDVPLNVRIEVVFTEPIDLASLSPQTFELRSGVSTIPGQVRIANPERTKVVFTPSVMLEAAREYELVLGPGIRDLDGTPLETGAIINFTTTTERQSSVGPFVVSNAVSMGASQIAFVSLPRNALPGADYLLIRTRDTSATVSANLVDGGLDPVAVRAAAGDTLTLMVGSSGKYSWYQATVPPVKAPVVIRTTPAMGERDVLTTRLVVVFSEPIHTASLTSQEFALRAGGQTIAGQIAFANDDHTVVLYQPAARLEGETDHELILGHDILDQDGTALESAPRISFRTAPTVPVGAQNLAFVRDGQIHLANADGSGVVRLTNSPYGVSNEDPAWSPDGKRLAFIRGRGDGWGDLYIMNADGSDVVQRTTGGGHMQPAWSPDGHRIAFSRGGHIAVIGDQGPLGAGVDLMPDRRGYNAAPAWSPDGQKLTFTSDWRAYDFVFDLYVMNADGSDIRTLIEGPFLSNEGPRFYHQSAWSPDGSKIAVVVCPYAWDDCHPESSVAVANADGTDLRILALAGGYARPTWSPDGRTIAFASMTCRTCPSSIRFVRADGSAQGLILTNGHSPAWRP